MRIKDKQKKQQTMPNFENINLQYESFTSQQSLRPISANQIQNFLSTSKDYIPARDRSISPILNKKKRLGQIKSINLSGSKVLTI